MMRALQLLMSQIVGRGDLTLVDADGAAHRFGDGGGLPVRVRFADSKLERQLLVDPQLTVGEAYMQGRLTLEQGTVYDFLALVMGNIGPGRLPRWVSGVDLTRRMVRRLHQLNLATRARRNVAHHYDISGRVYDLFLDPDRQYSCGYFTPGADLASAQLAKKRHIAAKLALQAGHRVLDIGSGWGGMALYLATAADAQVTGITLSTEQLRVATDRAQRAGLGNSVRFELVDYRAVSGRFDRIVSVGMFEHVGINHFNAFFRKVADLLEDDGVALIHAIGRADGPGITNPFIAKYIFPGGYIPALSEVLPAIERAGLIVSDVEILRLHYAETLKAWRASFAESRDEAVRLKGEEFARMWEFYLAASEAAFRFQHLMVFQIQLTKQIDAVPITRDYMIAAEHALALAESRRTSARMAGE